MGTYIPLEQAYIQQSYKTTINGKVVKDDAMRAIYNGKNVDVDVYDNGKLYHSTLNKKDIESMFSRQKHPLSLEKRLIKDFGLKLQNKKTRKHKRSKRMRTHKKTNNKLILI